MGTAGYCVVGKDDRCLSKKNHTNSEINRLKSLIKISVCKNSVRDFSRIVFFNSGFVILSKSYFFVGCKSAITSGLYIKLISKLTNHFAVSRCPFSYAEMKASPFFTGHQCLDIECLALLSNPRASKLL